jgi:type I restriction enzyme S subunit
MSSEWKDFQLGELTTFKYGKFLAKSQLDEAGFPVFSGYGIVGYLPTYQFDEPQLLIVCRGEGGTGDVKMSPSKCSITNLSIVFSPNEQIVSKNFLYWALKASDTHRLRTGSAQAQIVIGSLEKFGIVIPTDRLQQAEIACTLDALDDRITLLRETNATLEAIAQALFKSWFVDFDPVRAKMEGRIPEGMDEDTARLFPDALEESELGLVPRGWKVGVLGDLLAPKRGKSITKLKCIAGNIPVVAGGLEPAYFHNQYNARGPVVTISASGANAGFVRLYQQDIWASDCSFISTEQSDTPYFWYLFLKFNQERIYSMQQGAAQPHISPSDLMRLTAYSQNSSEIRDCFNKLVSPFFARIGLANFKIQTLATLRDTLLPRLISGQLRLPEVTSDLAEIDES